MDLSKITTHPVSQTAITNLDTSLILHHIGATQEGGSGNDRLYGTVGNDVMYGNAGDDQFHLIGGNDKAYGGAGNDFFDIGTGNHTASGGEGNDLFYIRGIGNDTLSGGNGADEYVFLDSFKGHATITDFNGAAGDHIVFAKAVDGVAWNADHTGLDYIFKDGSSVTFMGNHDLIDPYATYL